MSKQQFAPHQIVLLSDVEQLSRLVEANPKLISLKQASRYIVLSFFTKSPVLIKDKVNWRSRHDIRLSFPQGYPNQTPPTVKIQSPVLFHPNVPPDGVVSIDTWDSTFEISELALWLWRLFTFQYINRSIVQNRLAKEWVEKGEIRLPLNEHKLGVPISTQMVHSEPNRLAARFMVRNKRQVVVGDSLTPPMNVFYRENNPMPVSQSLIRLAKEEMRGSTQADAQESVLNDQQGATSFRLKGVRRYQPPERSFPWRRQQGKNTLTVVFRESTFQEIQKHASKDMSKERFGILVGNAFSDPQTYTLWVEVTDMLPAEEGVKASLGSVEVPTEELIRLDKQVDQILDQGKRKVGWYHTHPGHGIFMSNTDKSNQALCYNADWQIALVVDPKQKKHGVFSGIDCVPVDDLQTIPDAEAVLAWHAWHTGAVLPTSIVEPARIPQSTAGSGSAPVSRPTVDSRALQVPGAKSISQLTLTYRWKQVVLALAIALVSFGAGVLWQQAQERANLHQRVQRELLQNAQGLTLPADEAKLIGLLEVIVTLDATSVEGAIAKATLNSFQTLSPPVRTPPPSVATPPVLDTPTRAVVPAATAIPAVMPTKSTTSTATATPPPTATQSPTIMPKDSSPTATIVSTGAPIGHVVESGQTLGAIAGLYGVSIEDILSVNPDIEDASLIYPGQTILIPQP